MSLLEGELEAANEIDDARWSSIEEARTLLTYDRDVTLLDLLEETA